MSDFQSRLCALQDKVDRLTEERDRYREALERIARRVPIMGSTGDYREGQLHALAECAKVASDALRGREECK